MKLKFFAKDDMLVTVPGAPRVVGQAPQYVGRARVKPENGPAGFQATSDAYECEAESDEGRALVARVRKELAQHGELPLWPGDEATAAACGVEFRKVSVKDGIATLATVTKAQPRSSGASGEGS